MTPPVKEVSEKRSKRILYSAIMGLGITLFFLVISNYIEHLSAGRRIEMLTYEILQTQVSPFNREEALPVVVVDISHIPGGYDAPTARKPLLDLINALARQSPKPIAIGVDIDLSPEEGIWQVPDGSLNDPAFFAECLRIEKELGVPIFLGVKHTVSEPSQAWLGNEQFAPLAAALIAQNKDTLRMPRWVRVYDDQPLLSLSAALASQFPGGEVKPPYYLAPFVVAHENPNETGNGERVVTDGGEFYFDSALVNYSKLEEIERESLLTVSPQSVNEFADRFKNRIIILGDGNDKASSKFNVPGRDHTISGVFLDACSVYTFIKEPVYEFKGWWRVIIDFTLSSICFGSIYVLRWRRVNEEKEVEWEPLPPIHARRTFFIVFIVGVLLMRWLDVMWLDFLIIALGILFHPPVEHVVSTWWEHRKQKDTEPQTEETIPPVQGAKPEDDPSKQPSGSTNV